jgi:anti-sigma factor RsiW
MTTTEHLSLVQVRAYVRGALHPSTLVTIDDHLETCAACRAALARESDASFGAEAFGRALATPEARPESPHLAFEHLRGAVDGTLGAADAEWVDAHTGLCIMCAEELRDLQRYAPYVPIRIDGPASVQSVSPTAEFEPPPLPAAEPIARRLREDVDTGEVPPAAYGTKPPERLPRWIPVAAGLSLLLLFQMWAC